MRTFIVRNSLKKTLGRGGEDVVQAVAEHVEADDDSDDRNARKEGHPGRLAYELARDIEHAAPGWRWRQLAEAEKGEACLGEHRDGHGQGGLDHDGWQHVWQHMAREDREVPDAL